MNEARAKQVALACIALAGLILLGSVIHSVFLLSDEDRVRRVLAAAAQAASENDPRGISNQLSEEFKVHYRRELVDRDMVHQAMVRLLMVDYRYGFELTYEPAQVPIRVASDGRSATARFKVSARGRSSKDGELHALRQREASGRWVYVATFANTDDGWKLHRLTFEAAK